MEIRLYQASELHREHVDPQRELIIRILDYAHENTDAEAFRGIIFRIHVFRTLVREDDGREICVDGTDNPALGKRYPESSRSNNDKTIEFRLLCHLGLHGGIMQSHRR